MTDIEQKALALVNEIERQEGRSDLTPRIMRGLVMDEALCRAIEQHEAFRQEVSDAVERFYGPHLKPDQLFARFILPKPVDPLVEAMLRAWPQYADRMEACSIHAAAFRAAIEKRGGKIVWGEG